MLAKRDILLKILPEIFRETILRVILRPTNVYARMLYQALSPQFLQDGFLYSLEMERFARPI
jgi:lantibiotic modifying enzyme